MHISVITSDWHGLLQVFWPSRMCLQPLSPWILYMLSGASSLTYASLTAEMLPCLPEFPTLESLHIDARDAMVVWDIARALVECHQLRSLTITCHKKGKDTLVPELDLRHFKNLRGCHLKFVPAPLNLCLPRGGLALELTVTPKQILAWSELWPNVRNHVQCITIEEYSHFSRRAQPARVLHACPSGIGAFHGLQFLQLSCEGTSACDSNVLDLAHLAYSLMCQSVVRVASP